MKKLLTASLLLLSFNSFSQSYLVLNNGITLTTDNSGFLYDFGHFTNPNQIEHNGGQFLVEDGKLLTVDSSGFLYTKDLKVKKIKGKGINYFLNNDNELITVDSKGFYYKFSDEKVLKKVVKFGGNFFLVKPDDKKPQMDLYTVNSNGNYFKMNAEGLNPAEITYVGGRFFQTKSGVIYTISKDGFVFPKADIKVGLIKSAGGNFLITMTDFIYTISEEGIMLLPSLPANFSSAAMVKYGANYLLDKEGRAFLVDKVGNVAERTLNHDLRNTKIISM